MTDKKAPKLETEIARLYRLGQKPIPYEGLVVTEVMMMLYLTSKYNIYNPAFDDIREEYKAYGQLDEEARATAEKPAYCIWELELDYDEKDCLQKNNAEEYASELYWKMRELIDANPGKKVICPFNAGFYTNGEVVTGHIETLIYDPALNILEHVDSNNLPKQCARKDKAYAEFARISSVVVQDVADMLEEQPVYVDNKDIYSGYAWGIQSLEAASDKLTAQERQGYCLMWASLFGDLALAFPEYSAKEIVETMMKKAKSKMNKAETVNDYFLFMIRGYVVEISKTLGVDFMDEESIRSACIRMA
jgi:hypothetical protein